MKGNQSAFIPVDVHSLDALKYPHPANSMELSDWLRCGRLSCWLQPPCQSHDTGSDLYLKQHNATIPCASKSLTAPLGLNEVVDLALCNNPQTREANET